jgi:hypothetical protein
MQKFTITETVPCVQKWVYEVEAANETEALELIIEGKVDVTNVIIDEHDYEETQYEIEDAE